MKTTEQFWNEIKANKELAEKLTKVTNDAELEALLKENEVDCTKEQFAEFIIEKAKERGALSDDKLESVAGGSTAFTMANTVAKGIRWIKSLFCD